MCYPSLSNIAYIAINMTVGLMDFGKLHAKSVQIGKTDSTEIFQIPSRKGRMRRQCRTAPDKVRISISIFPISSPISMFDHL